MVRGDFDLEGGSALDVRRFRINGELEEKIRGSFFPLHSALAYIFFAMPCLCMYSTGQSVTLGTAGRYIIPLYNGE